MNSLNLIVKRRYFLQERIHLILLKDQFIVKFKNKTSWLDFNCVIGYSRQKKSVNILKQPTLICILEFLHSLGFYI